MSEKWYEKSGEQADVVLSSRVRFARNIEGYPFEPRLTDEGAKEIIEKLSGIFTPDEGYEKTDFTTLSPLAVERAAEDYTVSNDFAAKKTPHALFANDDAGVYVMACEEDHVRIQAIVPGLDLAGAYSRAESAERLLDAGAEISFSERLGYLTHCPTNLGTAMRASVMMFLPALTMNKKMRAIANRLAQIGLTVRGADGEGSSADGAIYQISNQTSLGISEEQIIEKLGDVVGQIIENERALRRKMSEQDGDAIRDLARRALGTALYAERMDSAEFVRLYANIRLGVAMGCVTECDFGTLDALRIEAQRAALTDRFGLDPDDSAKRDRVRAKFVRETIASKK